MELSMNNNCDKLIQPYATSGIVKEPNFINLNYTNQDFWSLKDRIREFMFERFGPEGTELPGTFNDFIESSIAIMQMEVMAFIADTLSFKMDQQFNERFLSTVTQTDNAFRIAKQFGMMPQPPISARSFWVVALNGILNRDVVIPSPVEVETSNGQESLQIELYPADSNGNPIFDQDIIIPAGKLENRSIVGLEGLTFQNEFVGTGEVSQIYQLSNGPVIYDSIRVDIDGTMWDGVEYFTDSQPRREYRTDYDADFNAYVIFGNNRAGLIPSQGSRIIVTYRTGGGVKGNIVTNYVQTQRQVYVPSLQFSVPVTYRNYTKGEFGYDGDGVEEIRKKLPKYLKVQDRLVSVEDYKNFADIFVTPYQGQVGKSTAVLRHHGCAANVIDLYVLAKDDGNELVDATSELKAALLEAISEKKMMTHDVCVKDGTIISVDVSIDITLERNYRKFESQNKNITERLVQEFFRLENWDFDKDLKDSDIIKKLSSVKEFQTIDISFITDDAGNSGKTVTTRFYEIIRPEDITISFIYV